MERNVLLIVCLQINAKCSSLENHVSFPSTCRSATQNYTKVCGCNVTKCGKAQAFSMLLQLTPHVLIYFLTFILQNRLELLKSCFELFHLVTVAASCNCLFQEAWYHTIQKKTKYLIDSDVHLFFHLLPYLATHLLNLSHLQPTVCLTAQV